MHRHVHDVVLVRFLLPARDVNGLDETVPAALDAKDELCPAVLRVDALVGDAAPERARNEVCGRLLLHFLGQVQLLHYFVVVHGLSPPRLQLLC